MTTKQRKSMKHLNIGDQILVDINNQNQPIYESVYAFIHASSNGIYDYLKITIDNNFEQPLIISNIRLIKSQGFYAPLTLSGKLVVDGIVVSNYAVVANHQLAHFVMQPYRWWIYFIKSSSYSENIHWYCQVLYNLVEHINKWLFSIELYDGSIIVSNI
ncbi:unnamed protein product [Rotaria sp. Silwood1]|nr:unnamed protein product [Rotaria sp. Silwood1]